MLISKIRPAGRFRLLRAVSLPSHQHARLKFSPATAMLASAGRARPPGMEHYRFRHQATEHYAIAQGHNYRSRYGRPRAGGFRRHGFDEMPTPTTPDASAQRESLPSPLSFPYILVAGGTAETDAFTPLITPVAGGDSSTRVGRLHEAEDYRYAD